MYKLTFINQCIHTASYIGLQKKVKCIFLARPVTRNSTINSLSGDVNELKNRPRFDRTSSPHMPHRKSAQQQVIGDWFRHEREGEGSSNRERHGNRKKENSQNSPVKSVPSSTSSVFTPVCDHELLITEVNFRIKLLTT